MLRFRIPRLKVDFSRKIRSQSTSVNELNANEEVFEDSNLQKEEELERKRNKSGLSPAHYRVLHGQMPYDEPCHWSHTTLRYHRKMYGVYGTSSNMDPRICWLDKSELASKLEYESLAEDRTIPEMIAQIKEKKRLEKEAILQRDMDVANKVEKIHEWKRDLQTRIKKKFDEAEQAKARKEKLIEEVRRHFGFKVDPKDERFKEMLEKKEKEQKKADKLAKKSAKEAKMLDLLKQDTAKLQKSEERKRETVKAEKPNKETEPASN